MLGPCLTLRLSRAPGLLPPLTPPRAPNEQEGEKPLTPHDPASVTRCPPPSSLPGPSQAERERERERAVQQQQAQEALQQKKLREERERGEAALREARDAVRGPWLTGDVRTWASLEQSETQKKKRMWDG
jgi:hypothetical protein